MMIKVVKNNNSRREESFFIEDVKDLSILKVGLGDVRDYVRSINPEFDEYCKTGRAINDITYANLLKYHNWCLNSLALKTVGKYREDSKNSDNTLRVQSEYENIKMYYNDPISMNADYIYMNNSNKINLFAFEIPDETKPNKYITCLLSTVNEDTYIINDKGQTVDSIRSHGINN